MRTLSFEELDKLFLDIEKDISLLNALKPTNLEEEKQKFFDSGYKYNPQFKYKTHDLSEYKKLLEDVSSPTEEVISELYNKKIKFLLNKILLIESIGANDSDAKTLINELFGDGSDDSTLSYALEILKIPDEKKDEEFLDFDEIVALVQSRLDELGLDTKIGYKDDAAMRFHVDHHNNKIFIPKNCKRTKDSIMGTLMHEINTHLLRAQNGKKQSHGIFFISTADYLPTEEGLACIMGANARTDKALRRPAKMAVVINATNKEDFIGTFNSLYSISRKPKAAWNFTMRVKRGIMDTSKPGGFTKDQYLKWGIELGRKLIKNPEGLNYIFNGKGTLEELMKYTQPLENHSLDIASIVNLLEYNKINF